MRRALIAYRGTIGLHHDALVLAEALRATNCAGSVRLLAMPDDIAHDPAASVDAPGLRTTAPFECLFLLEHVHANPPLIDRTLARRIVFVPNWEWLFPGDEAALAAGTVDAVAFKNDFSRDRFLLGPAARGIGLTAVTGWSSLDIAASTPDRDPARFQRFLHVGGGAALKRTDLVLETWMRRPNFPPLTVVRHVLPDPTSFLQPLRYAPNVTVHLRYLTEQELRTLQHRCGVHVYPSLAEGFGHALNEARAASAVLVATDGEPMRNLVSDGETGFLAPVDAASVLPFRRSLAYPVSEGALAETVERVLAESPDRRRQMGERAHLAFLEGRAQFHGRVRALWQALGLPVGSAG